MIRLIDADKLKKKLDFVYDCAYIGSKSKEGIASDIIEEIDNAPIVESEITEEQAIDKLRETGWIVKHDKEMTERPKGVWVLIDAENFIVKCSVCGRIEDSHMVKFYPFCHCGARMKGSDNE